MSSRANALPLPDAAAVVHGRAVIAALRAFIDARGGWISFDAYMNFVLYAPGLGYYVAGARKFGADGDFVTAPEMTPLYGAALAAQVASILGADRCEIVELGAGSGRLAADLLVALDARQCLPARYAILEVSPDLRERQRATLRAHAPRLAERVAWIDTLPERIAGAVLMNEVLDAVPCSLVARVDGRWLERGVTFDGERLVLRDRPLVGNLLALAEARFPTEGDYQSELCPAAGALVETVARRLRAGAIVIVDYGFPRHELYHPQRTQGTLRMHYRHRAFDDPLVWPGLVDITAHVDFTAAAEAGVRAGLQVAGFASQAGFLLGCGVLDRLAAVGPVDSVAYLREAAAVQRLTSPAEMGELFKVLALARSDDIAWPGFTVADMRHRL